MMNNDWKWLTMIENDEQWLRMMDNDWEHQENDPGSQKTISRPSNSIIFRTESNRIPSEDTKQAENSREIRSNQQLCQPF